MTRQRRVQAKLVLLALADVADDEGANAWPSVATLGRMCEMSPRTITAVLADLRTRGMIAEQARPGQHRPRTWRLILNPPNPSDRQHDVSARQVQRPDRQDESSDRQHFADDPDLEPLEHIERSEKSSGAGAPRFSATDEKEREGAEERYRIFSQLAQDAIDELGETSAFGELTQRLRTSAADYRIPYDESAACSALTFALVRRRRRSPQLGATLPARESRPFRGRP